MPMTKEYANAIKNYMEKLGISKEEAIQLYEDDHAGYESPEMKEMERKAKSNKRYEKSVTPRKKAVKERKIDPNKLALSFIVGNALNTAGIKHTPKNESEFHFSYCGDNFTIKLIKHRAPK